jgi:hypothetical protein
VFGGRDHHAGGREEDEKEGEESLHGMILRRLCCARVS